MNLKREFDEFYKSKFGNHEFNFPLFDKKPFSIKLRTGSGSSYNDEWFVKDAVSCALAIFEELFSKDDTIYIAVDSYEDDLNKDHIDISVVRPLINNIQGQCKYVFTITEDDLMGYNIGETSDRYIVKASVENIQVEKLLEEIAWSIIDRRNSLDGCVYFINPRNNIIYHFLEIGVLYVISNEKANIDKINEKYKEWINDSGWHDFSLDDVLSGPATLNKKQVTFLAREMGIKHASVRNLYENNPEEIMRVCQSIIREDTRTDEKGSDRYDMAVEIYFLE